MTMPPGLFVVGNKVYGVCAACKQIVRVNKWLFGSLHFCK